jgi:hypothetical protein
LLTLKSRDKALDIELRTPEVVLAAPENASFTAHPGVVRA